MADELTEAAAQLRSWAADAGHPPDSAMYDMARRLERIAAARSQPAWRPIGADELTPLQSALDAMDRIDAAHRAEFGCPVGYVLASVILRELDAAARSQLAAAPTPPASEPDRG